LQIYLYSRRKPQSSRSKGHRGGIDIADGLRKHSKIIKEKIETWSEKGRKMKLTEYKNDHRKRQVLSAMGQVLRSDIADMYLYAQDRILPLDWHWLKFHFLQSHSHPIGLGLAKMCARIEKKIPGAGTGLIDKIASLANSEKNSNHYQQILQVFAEVLVIECLVGLEWPAETAFFYEPKGLTGKRPELMVSTPAHRYLFEVKSPSLLDHQEARAKNGLQIPHRHLPLDALDKLVVDQLITLPRDTPVKDFLVSSEQKFADFPVVPGANILIIVWDDYIYEPLGSLIGEPAGLLTPGSWYKDSKGAPVSYDNIDGIVLVRHMTYFQRALADHDLQDRFGAFDFGSSTALPNVFIPTTTGRNVDELITRRLRAMDFRDQSLENAAEYKVQDYVVWL
jgi:hypothetical protein